MSTSPDLNCNGNIFYWVGFSYELPKEELPDSTFGWITLSKTRDMLHSTATRQPFFGCFGLHEWAMLYSGRMYVSEVLMYIEDIYMMDVSLIIRAKKSSELTCFSYTSTYSTVIKVRNL